MPRLDSSVFSAMQDEKPYSVYKKTTLGKVEIWILNQFSGEPERLTLYGVPERNDDGCFVKLWSNVEDIYFKRANKKHFESGNLLPVEVEKISDEIISVNMITDEEIEDLLNSPFLKLQNKLNEFTTIAPVARILNKAHELEKSAKIVKRLEERMSELQELEYAGTNQ